MELAKRLVCVLLILTSVDCFPSKPLSDRPSETWQAWLLVDSQNQQQNETDRRITPKSVFIAPKLPLPDCAEGYKADSMGRCVKVVKIDDQAHMLFILDRLNGMFSQSAEDDEEELEIDETVPTAGPLQVNIPLGQSEETESSENTKAQIEKKNVQKLTVSKEETENEESTTTLQTELLTTIDEVTTELLTTMTSTEYPTTMEETTTTLIDTTTGNDEELKALFFLSPKENSTTTEKNEKVSTETVSQTVKFPSDGLIRFPADVELIRDALGDSFKSDESHNTDLTSAQIQNLFKKFEQRLAANAEHPRVPQYVYNHRNRDRNGELFWRSDSTHENPLILRYARYPSRHHSHHNPKYLSSYRPEDVTYYGDDRQDFPNTYSRKRRRDYIR